MNDKQITKVIYSWVADNFGESEADEPSWSIELLAMEISEKLKERVKAEKRLKYISRELDAERISYGELADLRDLVPYMDGDMRLLEAAGIPEEFAHRECKTCGELLTVNADNDKQEGFYCCDEYYCSKPCLNASFTGIETWEEHYSDDGDCYWTEWEAEDE